MGPVRSSVGNLYASSVGRACRIASIYFVVATNRRMFIISPAVFRPLAAGRSCSIMRIISALTASSVDIVYGVSNNEFAPDALHDPPGGLHDTEYSVLKTE